MENTSVMSLPIGRLCNITRRHSKFPELGIFVDSGRELYLFARYDYCCEFEDFLIFRKGDLLGVDNQSPNGALDFIQDKLGVFAPPSNIHVGGGIREVVADNRWLEEKTFVGLFKTGDREASIYIGFAVSMSARTLNLSEVNDRAEDMGTYRHYFSAISSISFSGHYLDMLRKMYEVNRRGSLKENILPADGKYICRVEMRRRACSDAIWGMPISSNDDYTVLFQFSDGGYRPDGYAIINNMDILNCRAFDMESSFIRRRQQEMRLSCCGDLCYGNFDNMEFAHDASSAHDLVAFYLRSTSPRSFKVGFIEEANDKSLTITTIDEKGMPDGVEIIAWRNISKIEYKTWRLTKQKDKILPPSKTAKSS